MSTERTTIKADNNEAVVLTEFNGGVERGLCVQLTQQGGRADNAFAVQWINLTVDQAQEMVRHLRQFVIENTEGTRAHARKHP